MDWRRWVMAAGTVGLMVAVAGPALAQERQGKGKPGGGGGGGNPPPACNEKEYVATLWFARVAIIDSEGVLLVDPPPALYATDDGPLEAKFINGVHGVLTTGAEYPLTLDFFGDTNSLWHDWHPKWNDDYPEFDRNLEFDPRVASTVFIPETTASLDCNMLGMEQGRPYRMSMSLWFEENTVRPTPYEDPATKSTVAWTLRYSPRKPEPETVTWLDAVRTTRTTWVLTSRIDDAHEASLIRWKRGGKYKDDDEFSRPSIPMQVVIEITCAPDDTGCDFPSDS